MGGGPVSEELSELYYCCTSFAQKRQSVPSVPTPSNYAQQYTAQDGINAPVTYD